ncbi:hypothetical protein TRIP_B200526 [uncultured Desulfatiglans sp.]|uniref:Uncharacterized protein n=1 Tax=Uncultured Desulfatiglans sp. TaxID=1748965 RepID=A0A653A2X8_UNCDX|nr:hypothetical protein TRIP_B200526 [uncultured Desulfatiglans sp.]
MTIRRYIYYKSNLKYLKIELITIFTRS